MTQVRLKNLTGGASIIGQLVKVSPLNKGGFVNVTDLTTLPVIGTVAESAPNGNPCLIDLINSASQSTGITVGPTAPKSPKAGDLWIDTSGT
jgi:hypothetical protein